MKYKSKPFIDTFIYRSGDFLGAWIPMLLGLLALPIGVAALSSSALWLGASRWLGRSLNQDAS